MKNVRIVIVDDSPFSIALLTDILTEKGFEVVGSASNLEETIQVVKDKKPDLVTMDMTMPGTDGLECTRAIHTLNPNIKVVIVSSMMDDEIVKKAKENKASAYVQKPVDPEEIYTVIKRLMASDDLLEELQNIYFDVFKEALSDNINRMIKLPTSFGEDLEVDEAHSSQGISIVVGIIGKFVGRMILDVSYGTAETMTCKMLRKDSATKEQVLAMFGEFANIVAGNACSILNRHNKAFGLRVAPPTIFHGSSLSISKAMMKTTSVTASTEFGELYLNVGFKRGEEEWT